MVHRLLAERRGERRVDEGERTGDRPELVEVDDVEAWVGGRLGDHEHRPAGHDGCGERSGIRAVDPRHVDAHDARTGRAGRRSCRHRSGAGRRRGHRSSTARRQPTRWPPFRTRRPGRPRRPRARRSPPRRRARSGWRTGCRSCRHAWRSLVCECRRDLPSATRWSPTAAASGSSPADRVRRRLPWCPAETIGREANRRASPIVRPVWTSRVQAPSSPAAHQGSVRRSPPRWPAAGARVVVADLQEDKGNDLATEIGGAFARVDVTNTDDIVGAVEMAKSIAPLRVLVNSAGIGWAQRTVGKDGSYESAANLDAFKKVIDINLIGSFDCIRIAGTAMSTAEPLESGERGAIVNVASVAAFDGQIGQAAYSASKGGIVGMTLPVARDLAAVGSASTRSRPGLIDTPIYGSGEALSSSRPTCRRACCSPSASAGPRSWRPWCSSASPIRTSTPRRSASTAASACPRSDLHLGKIRCTSPSGEESCQGLLRIFPRCPAVRARGARRGTSGQSGSGNRSPCAWRRTARSRRR